MNIDVKLTAKQARAVKIILFGYLKEGGDIKTVDSEDVAAAFDAIVLGQNEALKTELSKTKTNQT